MGDVSEARGNRFIRAAGYRWPYAAAGIVLFFGLVLSVVVYVWLRNQERNGILRDFERISHDRDAAIEKTVGLDILALQAVRAFYDGSNEVTRSEFRTFTDPFMHNRPSIRAIIWAPRVVESERSDFEHLAHQEGIADFQIYESAGNKWVRAKQGGEHFPFFFINSIQKKVAKLGKDLAAIPECRQVMEKARDMGGYQLTGKMAEPSGNESVETWVFFPVYMKGVPINTVLQRRNALRGYIVGILSPKWIVKEGMADLLPTGINVDLYDTTVEDRFQPLYRVTSRIRQSKPDEDQPAWLRSDFRDIHDFHVANRKWSLVCTTTPFFVDSRTTWYPAMGAVGIVLLSLTLGFFLVVIAYRNAHTVKLANRLVDTNQQLEREVAGREHAESILTTSETKYQTLFEASADAIMTITPQGKIVDANRAAVEHFRFRNKDDFVSVIPSDVSPEYQPDGMRSVEKVQLMLSIAMRKGFHRFEWLHKRHDGSEFLGMLTLTKMKVDGDLLFLVTLRDIDEQQRAEKSLQASERRFRLFAENVEDVLWSIDLQGNFTYMSPSVERMLGFKWEESLKVTIADIMTPESLAQCTQALQELIAQAAANKPFEARKIELQLLRTDGSMLWGEIAVGALYDEKNEIIGALGVTRDVSERKKIENELRKAKKTAEAATKSKSQFLATMSHEIRTPMTAILGYADLLLDPAINASTRNNYAATIRRSGEHLLTLINDILDISKIEAGKMTMEIGSCKIVSLLADVASVVRPRAEADHISFSIDYKGPVPETISTDGARLRQVIINLVGNAVKFTEKGSVRIEVSFLEKGEFVENQPAMQFKVIDTGIGIHEEVLKRLFKPFVQGDTTITQKFGGTGLGLAISRHIAHMLDGELTVASVWQEGSTFTLTIPIGDLEGVRMLEHPGEIMHETKEHAWQAPTKSLQGVEILLAEDGYDNQRLIQTVLAKAGANVKVVENGRLAVDEARQRTFDVILMDMNMPVMDGYEATSVLREQGYSAPILALTANAMTEDRQRCRLTGCDGYLTKPIDRVLLIQTIAQYAEASKMPDADQPRNPE